MGVSSEQISLACLTEVNLAAITHSGYESDENMTVGGLELVELCKGGRKPGPYGFTYWSSQSRTVLYHNWLF